jgi:AraC-like DNA-binding protein
MQETYAEIDGVIDFIHRNIDEPLPLERLAKHAAYSPFHFTRIFKQKIGLPPLYFVSSLRLQKAKDLLLRTNYSVRDVGMMVGQQSLGTFTSRFAERVGVTPAEFRRSAQSVDQPFGALREMRQWKEPLSPLTGRPSQLLPPHPSGLQLGSALHLGSSQLVDVEGAVRAAKPFRGIVLIGLFTKPIPEGMPRYGTLLSSLGPFHFADVAPGTYYLLATAISWEMNAMDILLPQATLRARNKTPLTVAPGIPVPPQELTLQPPQPGDPPILVSLPLLMNRFLDRFSILQ